MKPDLQRRVQRYGWDKAAKYYENFWQAQLRPAHDLLIEISNVQTGESILDIAAGTGLISFRLAEKVGSSGSWSWLGLYSAYYSLSGEPEYGDRGHLQSEAGKLSTESGRGRA